MTRITWVSDCHLDHLNQADLDSFLEVVAEARSDAVIFTGDITTGYNLRDHIPLLDRAVGAQAGRVGAFVLGNHDYWDHRQRAEVRVLAADLANASTTLTYLGGLYSEAGLQAVTLGDVYIIGQDGWYDGRSGTPIESSPAISNDWKFARDMRDFWMTGAGSLSGFVRSIADEQNASLASKLAHVASAQTSAPLVVVATHVPPYLGATVYRRKQIDDAHAPYYVNTGAGDVLDSFAQRIKPRARVTVLAGHTHNFVDYTSGSGVRVLTQDVLRRLPSVVTLTTEKIGGAGVRLARSDIPRK